MNTRMLNALSCQPVDATPVWIMRQAGRYLPEYRAIRKRAGSFMKLCQTPELACEVTLQPLARFDLDAAILFSDILTIPDAMGLGLKFNEGSGPYFEKPLTNTADILNLPIPDPEKDLRYVTDAVRLIRHELANKIPLIGFAGSPWTLATYMIEGGSSKTFSKIRGMLYQDPQTLKILLHKLTQAVTLYLNAQIQAGAQIIMLFDTWGGLLSTDGYNEFSLQPMMEILAQLQPDAQNTRIPTILFTKNGGQWLSLIKKSGVNAIGLDWTMDIKIAREVVGSKIALQGNLDPAVLYAEPETIQREVEKILEQFGHHPGHIFNLGHGIYPDIDPEHVKCLIDTVHDVSRKYHNRDGLNNDNK